MKTTTLYFILFLLFTQCYKTTKLAAVPAEHAINGADNYVGWNNYSFLTEQMLHISSTSINFYNTGSLRITLPSISNYQHLPNFYDNTFIGYSCNSCIPDVDNCNTETDSEINTHSIDTTLYNNPLPLPGC